MTPADDRPTAERWLLLIHQLPAQPAYLRVKVWRRLQALGAAAVKNAVYALPATAAAREDFAWLLREIASGGGEAFVCEARMIDGLTDREVRAMFDRARDAADTGSVAANWTQLQADPSSALWTDDYSNILGIMLRKKLGW